MSNLKLRLISGFSLLFIFLGVLFFASKIWFTILFGVLLLLGSREYFSLFQLKNSLQIVYILVLASLMFFSPFFAYSQILIPALVFWLLAILGIIFYKKEAPYKIYQSGVFLVSIFLFVPPLFALSIIRSFNIYYVLLAFFLIFASDVGAYFAGTFLGKHPFFPSISPKKTIEGFIGGMLFSFFIAGCFYYCGITFPLVKFATLVIFTNLAAVFGDLFESMIKRIVNVKNSSELLPGHGGILDRLDSLVAAIPIFAYILISLP